MKTRSAHAASAAAWRQVALTSALALAALAAATARGDIPRTTDGKPDLAGYYDTATVTPLERRGSAATVSEDEAGAPSELIRSISSAAQLDPDREAPPAGGDGSPGQPEMLVAIRRSGSTLAKSTPGLAANTAPRSSSIHPMAGCRSASRKRWRACGR